MIKLNRNMIAAKCTLAMMITALIISIKEEASAGAWTRNENSVYAKLAFSTLSTNTFHTKDGDKISTADFQTWSLDLYGEYGLLDRLTAVVKFPILKKAGFVTTQSKTGIGDLGLELKYGLVTGSTPVAIGVGVDLPTGDENGFGLLKDQVSTPGGLVRLPTGDGEFNTRINVYVSHSFYPVPAYLSIDGGYNFRTKNFTNEYVFGLQGGYKIAGTVWLQANLRGMGPVRTPDPDLANGAALGLGEGVQYTTYSFGAAYEIIPHYAVSFDFFSAFGKITNIYSGINFVLGVSIEY